MTSCGGQPHHSTTEVAIIADDLTGAADTGVQFCPFLIHPILISYQDLTVDFDRGNSQALAIYTNTRSVTPEQAFKRVRSVARQLLTLHSGRIFKKVDSCLRGNVGAEVDAIMDEMGFELSFIAPAFPEMGRTTVHDTHLLHGVPIAETELSRDPVTPVRESRLSRIIASQSQYKVGRVDVRSFGGIPDLMEQEVTRLVASGVRHLVFDATYQAHLARIMQFALKSPKEILLVGSAGLAGSFASHFQKRGMSQDTGMTGFGEGHHLLVSGTASDQTRRQISVLIETYPYRVMALRPELLADPACQNRLIEKVSVARRLLFEDNLIITIDSPKASEVHSVKTRSARKARQIVEGLGSFVATIMRETRPRSLFLSGGDTATAVLAAIHAKGIRLHEEILPGVALGTVMGAVMDGLPVVTKAGAFGGKETLLALHEYWTKRAKRGKQ